MNAPDPSKLAAELRDIVHLAAELEDTYRWLYPSGFARDTAGERVGGGRGGSPVESVHGARGGVRSKLASVGRAVAGARHELLGAGVRLNEIATIIDDGCEHSADVAGAPQGRLEAAERRYLLAAQQRRQSRGEGYGGTLAVVTSITSLACAECKNEPRRRGNELGESCYKRRQRAKRVA